MTSLAEAVRAATHTLAEAGVPSAPVDALLLAAHALGVDPAEARRLLVLGVVEAPEAYAGLVAERAHRVPLQHLTGQAHFRRLTLAVGPGVFVPRPETELLVEAALKVLPKDAPSRALDLCTGSGCVALSLALERPKASVWAVDATYRASSAAWRRPD
jgi:release factor glutamine methyltransferase